MQKKIFLCVFLIGSTALAQPESLLPHLQVPKNLEVNLWAASPMFYNPTGLCVDDSGAIWVSEAVNYRSFRNKSHSPRWHDKGDRIMILRDTDSDGQADSSELFVQDKDLVSPLGVMVVGDKVYVSTSPHLLVFTRDADNRMIDKQIFLTGWGGLDHDHSLHKMEVGPDGRFYLNAGNAGPHNVTGADGWTLRSGSFYTGGSPYNTRNEPGLKSDDGRIWVAGIIAAIQPDGHGLHVLGHGCRNNYGHAVDSYGDIWVNDNDDTQSCRTTWQMRYGDAGYCSKDGTRSWRADKRPNQSVRSAHWRQDDPGVIPSGHVYGNGAPCGLCVVETSALGPEFDDMVLSCEAGQNVVWGYRRTRTNAGFATDGFPFMTSTGVQDENYVWSKRETDQRLWFRPSDVVVGTDGAVYISDWNDPVVGGHQMDDRRAQGAIYRVTRVGENPKPAVYTDALSRLASPAPNIRAETQPTLGKIKSAFGSAVPTLKARLLWKAAILGDDGIQWIRAQFDSLPADLRITALRCMEQFDSRWMELADHFATDPDAGVRRELCLALRDQPLELARPRLIQVARQIDGEDRWAVEALGTACEGREMEMYASLLASCGAPTLKWSESFAAIAWRLHPFTAVPAFRDRALHPELSQPQRKRAIDSLAFVPHESAAKAMQEVVTKGPEDLRNYANYWLGHRAKNDWREYGIKPQKNGSTSPVTASRQPSLPLEKVFESKILKSGFVDVEIGLAGMRNFAIVADDAGDGISCDWANVLNASLIDREGKTTPLDRWSWGKTGYGKLNKNQNCQGGPLKVNGELYKTGWGGHAHLILLKRLPSDHPYRSFRARLAVDDGGPEIGGAMHKSNSASVRFRLLTDVTPAPAKLPPLSEVAAMKGDIERGKVVYMGACMSCHQIGELGLNFGPALNEIGKKFDRENLIHSIVHPNEGILVGFEGTRILTTDGHEYIGVLTGEGKQISLMIAAGAVVQIDKAKIEHRELLKTSLMPALPLTAQQLADLTSYLRNGK